MGYVLEVPFFQISLTFSLHTISQYIALEEDFKFLAVCDDSVMNDHKLVGKI